MRIPYISDYFKTRREEAKKELEKLREFYRKENNPAREYNKGRELLSTLQEKSPIRALRKIQKEMDKAHGRYIFIELEKFNSLKDNEKKSRAIEQIKEDRRIISESYLERWAKEAEPILERIMEQNPESIIGFEYYSHYSGGGYGEGPIYEKIAKTDKEKGRLYTKSFSGYGEHDFISQNTCRSIAHQILKQILPNLYNHGYVYLTEWEGNTGHGVKHRETKVLNKERNKIVKEIAKRTGRNLKKEILKIKEYNSHFT